MKESTNASAPPAEPAPLDTDDLVAERAEELPVREVLSLLSGPFLPGAGSLPVITDPVFPAPADPPVE